MKGKFILFFLILALALDFVSAATLHGSIYDSSYKLLKDVRLEINTTPKQHHVSKNGLYFFYVPLGTYEITAEKYYQKELAYSSKAVVSVLKDGEFGIDIVMELQPGMEAPPDEEDLGPSLIPILRARYGYLFYVGIVFGIILLALAVFLIIFFLRKKKTKVEEIVHVPSSETIPEVKPVEKKVEPVQEQTYDLDNIIKIIKEEGGRATQRDIRGKIPLSEAKVSLMISELESKGKIQKIKKGRGNILVLK